jgi:2-dehydro-3-deoxyphosphooctonate aldolase (KDO 8-P synthase)
MTYAHHWDGTIALGVKLQKNKPLIIAGPCMFEHYDMGLEIASFLIEQCKAYDFQYVFKSSYDKANRTSVSTPRGPGLEKGLKWLETLRSSLGVPTLTDVHSLEQVKEAAKVVDIIQIPAFLSRHRELLIEASLTGKVVQIKKGQWLSAEDMIESAELFCKQGNSKVILAERGTCFGYNNLVVDFRNLVEMKEKGFAVVFDATHAVQLPGAGNGSSSGLRHMVRPLARAAASIGVDGIFMEVHPNPAKALSDADTQIHKALALEILGDLARLRDVL